MKSERDLSVYGLKSSQDREYRPPVITIDELERLRGTSVASLRALVAAEPALELRLCDRILPALVSAADSVANRPVPASHVIGTPAVTRLPRAEVAGWLAHLLLGRPGTPDRIIADTQAWLSVGSVAPQELAKLRCVLAYFDRLADGPPRGMFEIERVVGTAHDWTRDVSPLAPLSVEPTGVIEDAEGCVQVDFANASLGGGVLSGGCVQEEIRFAVCPELIVGMLVSPWMSDHEAILLRGAEQFSTTSGYAFGLRYAGDYIDPCARDADGTVQVEVVAIDGMDYRRSRPSLQYESPTIRRELDKARIGFGAGRAGRAIATGNWGCGAFLGDPHQKAIIQWLAASSVGRATRYFTFGDPRVADLADVVARARQRFGTVGALATDLLKGETDT